MSQPGALPAEILELFGEADAGDRVLAVPLPPGRAVRGNEGDDERPALWVSNRPVNAGLWPLLRAEHPHSGLWPLLLATLHGDPRRPWDDGEVWPGSMSSPHDHDAEELLAGWWADYTRTNDDDSFEMLSPAERLAVTAPYGQRWPGLAAGLRLRADPDAHADSCADELLESKPGLRLGLVVVDRGSDAISVAGWQGPANYVNDTAKLSAVLRSWEHRFGARVIGVGYATLYLSVAAPPSNSAEAIQVAAEHFAFCPDNVWQGVDPLQRYADGLIDAPIWSFWWD